MTSSQVLTRRAIYRNENLREWSTFSREKQESLAADARYIGRRRKTASRVLEEINQRYRDLHDAVVFFGVPFTVREVRDIRRAGRRHCP